MLLVRTNLSVVSTLDFEKSPVLSAHDSQVGKALNVVGVVLENDATWERLLELLDELCLVLRFQI